MTNLFQSLQDLKFFLEPSIRVPKVILQYDGATSMLSVFTGNLYGELSIDRITDQNWAVDADRLNAVLREDSKLRINDSQTQLIVQNGRSTFRLPLILNKDSILQGDHFPESLDWLQLSDRDVAAIKLAAGFS